MSKSNKTTKLTRRLSGVLMGVGMLLLLWTSTLVAAESYPFNDASLPLEVRVNDLLGRLTLAEKISFFHQCIPAVSRLGIASFRTGTEALHGISWLGRATVFPQATGLGCTWDTGLIKKVGSAVGDEARGFHVRYPASVGLSLWAPVVDLERDPRAGRFEEGYSEDPYLVGQLAIAYSTGLKGDDPFYYKAIPTLKHFYCYNQEANRDTISVTLDERNKHEYYMRSFQYPIEAGVAKSLMTSYNLINGVPCTVAAEINASVKQKWAKDKDFFVVTDAFAPDNLTGSQAYYADAAQSHAGMIKAGVDSMTQDSESNADTVNNIAAALERGLITETDINNGVKNILRVRFHTGEFDSDATKNPYAKLGESEICAADHAKLALVAARKQLVLLKNTSNFLPLKAKSISKLAVVGPLADQVLTDFYSGSFPYTITTLDGIRGKVGSAKISFSRGVDQIALKAVSNSKYVTAPTAGGQLTASADTITDNAVYDLYDFDAGQCLFRSHGNDLYLTGNGEGSAKVKNTANAPGLQTEAVGTQEWFTYQNFNYELQSDGTFGLYNYQVSHWDTGLTGGKYVTVNADTAALSASATAVGATEKFEPVLVADGVEKAVAAATGADVAVVVVGNEPMLVGRETLDRTTIGLPADQEALIKKVAAVNPNTVVVLISSYPYAIGEIQKLANVKAILYSAHGGQEEGRAIADGLFGDYAPAGRLNSTWYQSLDQIPAIMDYDIINGKRTYMYFEGAPLYPFGYGLTYTTFKYNSLRITTSKANRKSGKVEVSLKVKNTGKVASDEVVQLYIHDQVAAVKRPIKELKGFKRVHLAPGASKLVRFKIPVEELAYWDVNRADFYVEPGSFEVQVGSSSADIKVKGQFTIK